MFSVLTKALKFMLCKFLFASMVGSLNLKDYRFMKAGNSAVWHDDLRRLDPFCCTTLAKPTVFSSRSISA
jgi:hypothetical protein